jgi:hypothetical protein
MNIMCITQPLKNIASTAIIVILFAHMASAQFYYKDIITTQQIGQTYMLYKQNAVSRVNVSAFDRNMPVTDAVVLQQTINTNQNTVITYTKAPDTDENWLKSYYNDKGQLIKTSDSTEEIVTRSFYEYNDKGLLVKISSKTEAKNNPYSTEEHLWQYNANGQPEKMLKIKNNSDTTFTSFLQDEQGNVAEEKSIRKGSFLGKIYYYYDAKNRLTDIARYNKRADKILPDYMFQYNDTNQLIQMIILPEGMAKNYQTWKYSYNANGLKTLDVCYNKQRELMGKAEYSYQNGK